MKRLIFALLVVAGGSARAQAQAELPFVLKQIGPGVYAQKARS